MTTSTTIPALAVNCPECGAVPGERCKLQNRGLYMTVDPPHPGRVRRAVWVQENGEAIRFLGRIRHQNEREINGPGICTAAEAAWCPVHGDCSCDRARGMADPGCRLHGPDTGHPDPQGHL